nr:MAG TPA: hypothetical protein [Caudoviricetes sp.]
MIKKARKKYLTNNKPYGIIIIETRKAHNIRRK